MGSRRRSVASGSTFDDADRPKPGPPPPQPSPFARCDDFVHVLVGEDLFGQPPSGSGADGDARRLQLLAQSPAPDPTESSVSAHGPPRLVRGRLEGLPPFHPQPPRKTQCPWIPGSAPAGRRPADPRAAPGAREAGPGGSLPVHAQDALPSLDGVQFRLRQVVRDVVQELERAFPGRPLKGVSGSLGQELPVGPPEVSSRRHPTQVGSPLGRVHQGAGELAVQNLDPVPRHGRLHRPHVVGADLA